LGTSGPEAIAFDHRGNLLVADTGNDRVLVVSPGGGLVREFGGYGWTDGRFDSPSDVCVFEGFFIYVLDEGNRRVHRYDLFGNFIDLLIEEGEAGSPVSMAVGQAGGLLLVDSDSQSVRSYSQFDEALEPVGQFGLGEGGLLSPTDVAVGPSREIAVADPGRSAVLVFDEFGTPLYTLAAPDTILPVDVVIGRRGDVFVADHRHRRVLLFDRSGRLRHSLSTGFRPMALALTGSGELAVLDDGGGAVHIFGITYASQTPEKRR
jgi:DNA-binding beta-propeller fold protein YncE